MRIIITPQGEQVSITVPKEYVGKQVEVTYQLVDVKPERDDLPSLESLFGSISKERAEEMHRQVREMRNEWD